MSRTKSTYIHPVLAGILIGLICCTGYGSATAAQEREIRLLNQGNVPDGLVIEQDGAIRAAPGYLLSRVGDTQSFVLYQQAAAGRSVRIVNTTPVTCACVTLKTSNAPCPGCPIVEPGCKAEQDGMHVRCKKAGCGKSCRWVE